MVKLKDAVKEFEHKEKMDKLKLKEQKAIKRLEIAKKKRKIRELHKKANRMAVFRLENILLGGSESKKNYAPKKKKSKPKTQYHVSGGKAYPIHTPKTKKKPVTKKKDYEPDWFNPLG